MHTETTTVFKSGGSQAVRIPRSMRLPDHIKELSVRADNGRLLLYPKERNLLGFFEEYKDKPLEEDIVLDRDDLVFQEREW